MTKRDLAAIACKVMGVYFIVSLMVVIPLLTTIPSILRWYSELGLTRFGAYTSAFGAPALHLVLGVLLWFGSDWLATRIVDDDGSAIIWPTVTPRGLLSVALLILATTVIVGAIPSLVHALLAYGREDMGERFQQGYFTNDMVKLIVGIAVAGLAWAVSPKTPRN